MSDVKVSIRSLADFPSEPLEWVWEGVIPRGKLTLLVGESSVGKSFVAMDIIARFSRGRAFPNDQAAAFSAPSLNVLAALRRSFEAHRLPLLPEIETTTKAEAVPGAVILFAAEDSIADTVRPRLEAAGADVEQVLLIGGLAEPWVDPYVEKARRDRELAASYGGWKYAQNEAKRERGEVETRPEEPWSFHLDRDLPNLEAELQRLQGLGTVVRLIVIDPINSCLARVDRLDDEEMKRTVRRLADLAQRSGAAILLISNSKQLGAGARRSALAADKALVGAARSVWTVVRDSDDPKRRMMLPVKMNLCEEKPGLMFLIEDGVVRWDTGDVRLSADEFLGRLPEFTQVSRRDGYGTELTRATNWLRKRLEGGQEFSCTIRRDAYAEEFSEITLRRAFRQLGCKAGRDVGCNHWHWRLPSPNAAPPEDASLSIRSIEQHDQDGSDP